MRELRFQISAVYRQGSRSLVTGRNCGDGLALGDALRSSSGAVRVEQILTYGRYLNVLDSGLTGQLELRGEGLVGVEPGAELLGRASAGLPAVEVLGEGEAFGRR